MKVICINNGYIINEKGNKTSAPELVENKIYSVIEETDFGYHLLEVHTYNPNGFNQGRFIPLSSRDETELLEQRMEQYQKLSV